MKLTCAILIAVMLHPSANTLQAQDLPSFPSFQTREEKRVLAPGGAEGTFRFRYEETIQWMGEPAFPVVVSVIQDRENVLVKTFDANPIELELDLKPGAHEIQSDPATIEAKKDAPDKKTLLEHLDTAGKVLDKVKGVSASAAVIGAALATAVAKIMGWL